MQVENIVTLYDVPNIWHIPLLLRVNSFFLKVFLCCSFYFLLLIPPPLNMIRIRRHMNRSWKNWTFKGLSYELTLCFNYNLFILFCSDICVFVAFDISIFFSIAREPDLHEWTVRTTVCDMLHDPVGFKPSSCRLRVLVSD